MIILALDTSTDYAVCSLGDENGHLYGSIAAQHQRSLSVLLYPTLDMLLSDAQMTLEQVGTFAAGIGPGSFTGVRVAVTTMRTLAQVTGKPLVAVPTLEIFAHAVLQRLDIDSVATTVCVLLPSRRNEVYGAVYRDYALDGAIRTASYHEARLLGSGLPGRRIFTGPEAVLKAVFPGGDTVNEGIRLLPIDAPDASTLAAIAARETRAGRFQNPLSLDPMYVAPPAISQHKTRLTGP